VEAVRGSNVKEKEQDPESIRIPISLNGPPVADPPESAAGGLSFSELSSAGS
jgi:hypothetical protein